MSLFASSCHEGALLASRRRLDEGLLTYPRIMKSRLGSEKTVVVFQAFSAMVRNAKSTTNIRMWQRDSAAQGNATKLSVAVLGAILCQIHGLPIGIRDER